MEHNNTSPITFCISTFNNLNYLKLAVKSVRTYSYFKNAPFIVYSENSTDGTDDWITGEGKNLYNLEPYIEKNEIPRGIGGGMNFCADKVTTEYIMFLHADFFVAKNWDLNALKVIEKSGNYPIWVSSQRIQPNIFHEESRPGTLIVPCDEFGEYYNNFNEDYFIQYTDEFIKLNTSELRKGEGVSGLIRKQDWDVIGGNSEIYRPAYFEDYDLFVRMQMENYLFILTSQSVVYHFGSRASRFPDDNLNQRNPKLAEHEKNSFKAWMNRWGEIPTFDQNGFITYSAKMLEKYLKFIKYEKNNSI